MLLAVSDSLWPFGLQAARLPGSSIRGIFQARLLEWVAISSSTVYSRTFLSPLEESHLPIPFYPPALGNHRLLSVLMGFPVLHFISMCGLFSLSIMFARLIHVATCISISFIFMAEWYPIVRIYNILFTHLPGDGYLNFSYFLTIVTVLSWTFTGTFLCSCVSSFLLCRYLGLKLLSHTATTRLTLFSELPECFHSICFAHHLFACWSPLLSNGDH